MRASFPREEIDAALAQAREFAWIDDRVFAKLWVEDRLLHHPLSRRAIEEELRARWVSPNVVASALDEHYPRERERDIALELARERLGRLAGQDQATQARRIADFLTRRGFAMSLAIECSRRALKGGERDG